MYTKFVLNSFGLLYKGMGFQKPVSVKVLLLDQRKVFDEYGNISTKT